MNPLERAGSQLETARLRHPLAVLPGRVLSPMDSQRTVAIGRELIDSCDPRRSQSEKG
ncbi:hypothetical protein [Nakamurella lactea]|uniref:hypothetical protein n=1 Tax=Nakamurella lactea TaxID=459515 RepID=UPI0003F4D07C|nr:hypothetical protein [Nakamurella lactea]